MKESEANLKYYLKEHDRYPFLNYRTNETEYMLAELFWLNVFKSVIGDNSGKAWVAWLPPDELKEGNPLFSAINYEIRRAFRVIHIFSQMEEDEIARKVHYPPGVFCSSHSEDNFGADPEPHKGAIVELTICCDISEEGEQIARKFIKLFCVENASLDVIESEIRNYEKEHFPAEQESAEEE